MLVLLMLKGDVERESLLGPYPPGQQSTDSPLRYIRNRILENPRNT